MAAIASSDPGDHPGHGSRGNGDPADPGDRGDQNPPRPHAPPPPGTPTRLPPERSDDLPERENPEDRGAPDSEDEQDSEFLEDWDFDDDEEDPDDDWPEEETESAEESTDISPWFPDSSKAEDVEDESSEWAVEPEETESAVDLLDGLVSRDPSSSLPEEAAPDERQERDLLPPRTAGLPVVGYRVAAVLQLGGQRLELEALLDTGRATSSLYVPERDGTGEEPGTGEPASLVLVDRHGAEVRVEPAWQSPPVSTGDQPTVSAQVSLEGVGNRKAGPHALRVERSWDRTGPALRLGRDFLAGRCLVDAERGRTRRKADEVEEEGAAKKDLIEER